MGQSTDGEIAFGVLCEDGTEFPWDAEEFDYGIEDWWRVESGFESIHQPYTPQGEYAEGWSRGDPRLKEYGQQRNAWDAANPLPVDLVNYCHSDVPMYVIAVPGVGLKCSRGYPDSFDPAELKVSPEQEFKLLQFLARYKIKRISELAWWLTSYWG